MPEARSNESGPDRPAAETLEELFAALESPLLSYAFRLLHDADMAQDVVQEAFVRLHAQFDQVRTPRSWLYRSVHNLALNHQRRSNRTVPLRTTAPSDDPATPTLELADPSLLPDEQIARWEGVGLVRLGLKSLDPRSRELIRLKFEENLSYKEISARTGLTTSNVGYLLHHSLKSLAAELVKAGLIP